MGKELACFLRAAGRAQPSSLLQPSSSLTGADPLLQREKEGVIQGQCGGLKASNSPRRSKGQPGAQGDGCGRVRPECIKPGGLWGQVSPGSPSLASSHLRPPVLRPPRFSFQGLLRNSIFLPFQTQSLIFFFMIVQWLHHLWHCIYIPGRYISEVLSDTSGKEALSRYI